MSSITSQPTTSSVELKSLNPTTERFNFRDIPYLEHIPTDVLGEIVEFSSNLKLLSAFMFTAGDNSQLAQNITNIAINTLVSSHKEFKKTSSWTSACTNLQKKLLPYINFALDHAPVNLNEASRLLEKIEMIIYEDFTDECNESKSFKSLNLKVLTEAYIKIGNLRRAEIAACSISNWQLLSELLAKIAKQHAKLGNFEEALRILPNAELAITSMVKQGFFQAKVLIEIVDIYIQLRKPKEATKALVTAEKAIYLIFNERPKSELLTKINEAQAKIHSLKE
ncbi:MAG: hypothetical protein PVI40_05185 [Chlamydiota bacterium]|jgi:hypothetical protein